MGDITKIEWTDHTFNAWWGCSRVSPACRFCYADRDASRWGHELWRRNGARKPMSEAYWRKPGQWNRAAEKAGVPAKVFCASMSDVFEDHPQVGPWRDRLWTVIESTPWLIWQLLTKRIENVADMVPWAGDWPRNVWIGTSVETQRFANQRIPALLNLGGAAVRFLSCEPLLGPVDLDNVAPGLVYNNAGFKALAGSTHVDWVIAGGESGPKARPSHPDWFRSLRDQCSDAGVPFLFKQWGEWQDGSRDPHTQRGTEHVIVADGRHEPWPGHTDTEGGPATDLARARQHRDRGTERAVVVARVGKKSAGRELDGRTWDEYPTAAEAVAA